MTNKPLINKTKSNSPVSGLVFQAGAIPRLILYHWDKTYTVYTLVKAQNSTTYFVQTLTMVNYDTALPGNFVSGRIPAKYPVKDW